MFEESLVESTALLRTRNRWPAAISIAIQAALAAAVLAVPLLRPDILPLRAPVLSLTPPVPPPPRVTPPPERVRLTNVSTGPTLPVLTASASRPIIGLRPIDPTGDSNDAPAVGLDIRMSGNADDATRGIMSATPSANPHIVAGPAHIGPVRVSPGVSAGLLLAPIRPVYPPIAITVRQQGTVIVRAIISKSGTIESASVVSGPAMLQQAALEAVRNARYRPYRLGNDPVEVDTTFEIHFTLSQQ